MNDKHKAERDVNLKKWEEKKELQEEYGKFYRRMSAAMGRGPSLELGSGLGHIKKWLPEVETSETEPGCDSVQSAYKINKQDGELGNILALDVWHHLEQPAKALKEWKRVLRDGGKAIMIEPAMGFLGNAIYSWVHHEGTGWNKPLSGNGKDQGRYFSAQSSAHRIFVKREIPEALKGWELSVEQWSALTYLTTGGYKKRVPGGKTIRQWAKRLEPHADRLPALFATRMIVVLTKKPEKNEIEP
jgi:SAM-dependent methyltransferase